jgi:nickel-type superoxide dismutase maturation protease
MFKIIRITGDSLLPVYQEGDFVLVAKIPFLLKLPRQGDVVIFRHAVYGQLIKEVERVTPQGMYVIGSHERSVDSRQFGVVPWEALVGKVIWHVAKPRVK